MNSIGKIALLIAIGSAIPASANATYINISFEGIAFYPNYNDVLVGNFYNGGVSSVGTSGANYGVTFGANARVLCLNSQTVKCSNSSRGGVSDFPDSLEAGLSFVNNGTDYINVANGFEQSFSFNYAAFDGGGPLVGHSVALFTGLNGTGTQIAFLNLTQSAEGCPAYGNAQFCPFEYQGIGFSGIARSIAFTNMGVSQIAIDDITLPLALSAVPETASWAVMLVGLAAVGGALRRRPTAVARLA